MLKRYFTYQVQQTIVYLLLIIYTGSLGPTADSVAEIKPEAKRVVKNYDEYAEQRNAAARARH